MSDLFASAEPPAAPDSGRTPGAETARPLADRLRPQSLAEVVGQEHLTGRGRRAHAPAARAKPRLADLLGTARHRQDHGGAAARPGHRPAFRADLGDLLRRARPAQGVRGRAQAPGDRAGDPAVRRRDPPVQPGAARRLPAGDGGRHRHAGRRDDREPLVRAERRAPVPGPGAAVPGARSGRHRAAAGPGRGADRPGPAAHRGGARACWCGWPTATAARR